MIWFCCDKWYIITAMVVWSVRGHWFAFSVIHILFHYRPTRYQWILLSHYETLKVCEHLYTDCELDEETSVPVVVRMCSAFIIFPKMSAVCFITFHYTYKQPEMFSRLSLYYIRIVSSRAIHEHSCWINNTILDAIVVKSVHLYSYHPVYVHFLDTERK